MPDENVTLRGVSSDPDVQEWAREGMDKTLRTWLERGDTDEQIARRIGLTPEQVAAERARLLP